MKMEESSESANLPNSTASASFLNNRASNIPSRCGSAPPRFSVEAYTSFRNSMVKQQLLNNFESLELESAAEERLLTDPSYIAYYNANVNLNPRLPPPLISRETRRLFEQALMMEHMLEDKSRSKDEIVDRDNTVSPAGCSKSFADLVQGPNGHTRAPGTTDPPTTSFPRGGNDNNMAAHDSTSSTTSVAGTVLTPMNISGASVSEHVERKHDNVRSCETYRSMPLYPPNCSIRQIQRFPVQTQYTPQGVNEPYIMHMFPGINPNMLNQGFVPAHYMNVGNHQLGTRFQMMNTFGSQFGLGGHALPSGFYPPYVGGNLSPNIYTFPTDPYAHHNLFNRGTAVQPHFSSPLQGQYFQHPFMDNNGRHAAQSSQYNNFLAQKDSNLAAFMYNDHRNLSYSGFIPIPQLPMSGRNHLVLGDHTSIPQCSLQRPDLYTGQKGQRGSCNVDDPKRHTYLETLKIGGASELELSDIAGKIVEFSTDQHGSRFIQQKLENSTVQEKEFVFTELLPHASRLMIDVFGNYVIQKLFEHGTGDHRRQLADQFTGQMLTLSLQMYGCRVIQKGLEVIEVDQKAVLAKELDGHVIKCVHDQNGNHVIQKCIEHIPADKIGFIISAFHGEVATLSVHPYGCRVIQRALEHCPDTSTTHFIIREILESASVLAHDQYGNYVIQHILELGKPHERSQVIGKLTGKFVEMSQHKYASNVIEKCLMYGGDSERESLIKEIVGRPEDDANLVIMMKDQYANYVIQKVIEICNDEEKNILMNCLMENLEYLKKYTYGKHIVSRYEQRLSGNQEQSAT